MSPEYQPANFAPGDEVPEWALDQVGEHVLVPEAHTESDDSDESGTSDESGSQSQGDGAGDEDPADDEDAEGDGEDSNPPAADDQPDFTAPAPARRNSRSRK
jgi:hypothetical protein